MGVADRVGRRGVRWGFLLAWMGLAIAIVLVALLPGTREGEGPSVLLILPGGQERAFSLREIERLPALQRAGEYQNQYGNWRDAGIYTSVRLTDLIGEGVSYESIHIIASDGYTVDIERARVEDEAFPLVLAYAFDGVKVPAWSDGFRIAVLPESGRVGNVDYGATSAGSFWVKNIARIVLQ